MGLLNVFAGAVSAGAQKVQEALATEQKAMTVRMLEEERQKFENTRQDKMIGANAALEKERQTFTSGESVLGREHAGQLVEKTNLNQKASDLQKHAWDIDKEAVEKVYQKERNAVADKYNQDKLSLDKKNADETSAQHKKANAQAYFATATAALVSEHTSHDKQLDKIRDIQSKIALAGPMADKAATEPLRLDLERAERDLAISQVRIDAYSKEHAKWRHQLSREHGFKDDELPPAQKPTAGTPAPFNNYLAQTPSPSTSLRQEPGGFGPQDIPVYSQAGPQSNWVSPDSMEYAAGQRSHGLIQDKNPANFNRRVPAR